MPPIQVSEEALRPLSCGGRLGSQLGALCFAFVFGFAELLLWLLPNNQKFLGYSLPSSKIRDPGAPAPVFAESRAATLTQETHWAVCPLSEFRKKLCVPYLVVGVLFAVLLRFLENLPSCVRV